MAGFVGQPRKAAEFMSKVAGAVHAAHQRGILHRDLKPGNILVDEAGEPHVTDFGLAKDKESASGLTLSGQIVGTPNYMAPEQAEASAHLTTGADVYGLGAVFYEMLCGEPPFKAETTLETLRMVTETEPRNPHSLKAGLNRDLSTIAMKCLSKDPDKRYASAQGLKNDLDRWLRGEPIAARPVGATEKVIKWMRRKPMHAAAATLAILFLLTLGIGGPIAAYQQAELRGEADLARTEARASEMDARASEAVATREKESARQALAKAQLDLAEKEFERGKFVEAQKILEETPESFRDANWGFQKTHSRDFTAQLSIPGKGTVRQILCLPQGNRFGVRGSYQGIGFFTFTGRQIGGWFEPKGHSYDYFGIARAGGWTAFPTSANEVTVQEVATGTIVRRWTTEISEIRLVLLSPDGRTALAAGGDQLVAYATESGAALWSQPFTGVVPAFSPDGRTVANLAAKEGLDLKIQLHTRSPVRCAAHSQRPRTITLQFNQTGSRLACLGGDEVILWNPKTAAKIRALHFPGESVQSLSRNDSD